MVRNFGMSLNGESVQKLTMSEVILGNILQGNLEEREQFIQLKLYLIKNFVEPLIYKDIKNVNLNLYNFSYILQKLNSFKDIERREVEIYSTIVEFVQTAVAQFAHTAYIEKEFYGSKKMRVIGSWDLPAIVLKAEYEIYNGIFGRPEAFGYDPKILKEIKHIIETRPGIMLKDVEYILSNKFKDTVLDDKFLKNNELDDDGEDIKIEYKIYKKLFKMKNDIYDKKLLEIVELLINKNPFITLAEIKKDIFQNNRYYLSFLKEDVFERDITAEEYYDSMFGKPKIGEKYNLQYLKLIKKIIKHFPNIEQTDLELEFEFNQPVWGEMLLKNQTLNNILFSNSRFKVNDPAAPPFKNMLKN